MNYSIAVRLATALRALSGSLFCRLSLAFFAVSVTTALLYAFVFSVIWNQFRNSADQRLYWEVAESLAHDLRPFTAENFNRGEVDRILYRFASYNPQFDVYVLNPAGRIVASVPALHGQLDTAPLKRFIGLQGIPAQPLFGPSARTPHRSETLFSAAPLAIEQHPGFVYVDLSGAYREKIFNVHGDTFATYSAAGLLILTLGVTFPFGILLFYLLTRRFHRMTEALQAFEAGDYQKRLPAGWRDELGIHAKVFNQLADSLTATIARLEEVDSSRRELVANISHDLRTPVAAMRASLETLAQVRNPVERDSLLRAAEINSQELSGLLEDLFALSRLEAPELSLQIEVFPLDEMVEDIITSQRAHAERAGIALSCSFDGKQFAACADRKLLYRAVTNLVENAIRYSLPGAVIAIRMRELNGSVGCEIADTGIGMSPEELSRVFERFYRAPKARALHSRGTGLGLNIVQRIFENHGAALEVQSAVGQGTRWHFSLPAAAARAVQGKR